MTSVLGFAPFGLDIPMPAVILGAIVGMTYGLLAVGLVIVYRANRLINFAHGQIGVFGAAVFGAAVLRWHVPYYLALPIAFAASGGAAALAEVAVVRRLRDAPRLMSIVATLGVGQFLLFFSLALNPKSSAGRAFPSPPGLPEFDLGALRLTQGYVGTLIGGPVAVVLLALFLRRSRFGLGIRCSAANHDAARMAGIFAARMSTLAWAIAGMLSVFTAILVLPSKGFTSGESFGPGLLLRALACAVIARMTSLPRALAAGLAIGVVEQVLLWNYPDGGLVEVALFACILFGLILQRGVGGREDEKGSWASVQGWRPLPDRIAQLPSIRAIPWALALGGLVVAALLPAFVTNSSAVVLTTIMAFAIVGLSVGIITGLGGQLSLGQFALASVGAVVSYEVSSRVGNFPLAFLCAGLAAAAVSIVIGLPALGVRGLQLTVTTLAFTLATSAWVLQQPWALNDGVDPKRPTFLGTALITGKQYYFFVLLTLVITALLAWNVRRGGIGRLLVAVRDNEEGARAFAISARTVKLEGFLLAGFVAGVGGAAYGHMLSRLGSTAFPTSASIDVVAMTVLGGMSLLSGPLIGAVYIIGVPSFLPLDSAGLAATQLGWLLLILYLPGGIAQGLEPIRQRVVDRLAALHGVRGRLETDSDDAGATSPKPLGVHRRVPVPLSPTTPLLEATGLCKRFGGVTAVDDVSIKVRRGETLGLIGPNGAGKTTTFEILSGFTRPNYGRVLFRGQDISALAPEDRARLGLIRSFQDAALYPTMTVLDTVRLAFERTLPTPFLRSIAGLTRSDREKLSLANDLIELMGLGSYRHSRIHELSTGTRRIAEIACLIALEPELLLLDEPSSGIAQRETEALGRLLGDLKRELDLTLIIIEHDIPMVMALSDRIVAMDAGRVIASGPPATVRVDPAVVKAYLGGDLDVINRSGARSPHTTEPGMRGSIATEGEYV